MLVHGEATDDTDDRGRPIHGDTMLLLINASPGEVRFTLPAVDAPAQEGDERRANVWTVLVDTARDDLRLTEAGMHSLSPYSLVLLRHGRERRLTLHGGTAAANAAAVGRAGEHAHSMVPEADDHA
jgi:isoamylase